MHIEIPLFRVFATPLRLEPSHWSSPVAKLHRVLVAVLLLVLTATRSLTVVRAGWVPSGRFWTVARLLARWPYHVLAHPTASDWPPRLGPVASPALGRPALPYLGFLRLPFVVVWAFLAGVARPIVVVLGVVYLLRPLALMTGGRLCASVRWTASSALAWFV